ncbi:hypothetical protein L195_g031416, partial [Trifolium pratense]
MGQRLLMNSDAESLCIGEYSDIAVNTMQKLGFSNVINQRFISFNKKNFVYSLHYRDFSFDFVLSTGLEKVAVPAFLVREVERILKPNGIGALLLDVYVYSNNSIDMLRIASPISLLRFSTILHVGVVNNHGLVIFKKNSDSTKIESEDKSSSLYHDDLQEDCKSVNFTKPLIRLMEPLVKERPYEKKSLICQSLRMFLLARRILFMLILVEGPRGTFVYYPELNENLKANVADTEHMDHHYLGEDEEFDLIAWFEETVKNADFVVLQMNAGEVEKKFLKDIYMKMGLYALLMSCFLAVLNENVKGCNLSQRLQPSFETFLH